MSLSTDDPLQFHFTKVSYGLRFSTNVVPYACAHGPNGPITVALYQGEFVFFLILKDSNLRVSKPGVIPSLRRLFITD